MPILIKHRRPASHSELYLRTQGRTESTREGTGTRVKSAAPSQAQLKRDALLQLLQIGGIGLGTGIAGRSLLGAARLLKRPRRVNATGPGTAVRPELRIPPNSFLDSREKQSNKDGWLQWLANRLPNIATKKPLGDVWGPPAALATAGLGVGGGYKLTDWLLNKEREMSSNRELEKSREDYEQSLADEYHAAMMAKQGSDTFGVDALFDALWEGREKRASGGSAVTAPWDLILGNDKVRESAGWLLAAMLATGTGTGYAMYQNTKAKDKNTALSKALRERARRRAALSPSPPIMLPPARRNEEELSSHGI